MQVSSQYQPKRLIRPNAVAERLGISKTTLYRMVNTGKLPAPVRISSQCTGWPEDVIDTFIAERQQEVR